MSTFERPLDAQLRRTLAALDSLVDGEAALAIFLAEGRRSIPYLEEYLLRGRPKTISQPRCRAVRALGELGAWETLITYFEEYRIPDDAQVRLAEDAVRSAAATELLRCDSPHIFEVLLQAAEQRATCGLVFALGELRRQEAVPFLFQTLGDDFCGNEARAALREIPQAAHDYAILALRNQTSLDIGSLTGLPRCRAILRLLRALGISSGEWQDIRIYLDAEDADVVIATAGMGMESDQKNDLSVILNALYRISTHINWAQEGEIEGLLDQNPREARDLASRIANQRLAAGETPIWLDPSWRILHHALIKS